MNKFTLGVDIGGTHITAAVVDLSNRSIIQESITRQVVDAGGSIADIISDWSNAMRAAMGKYKAEITQVGIAMPGPFNYECGISLMQNQDKYDALYGINVKELLAKALHFDIQNIRFQNDAPCFLQGEAFAGAAQGYDRAIGLTLGTGLGSAVIVDGKAWDANLWDTPFNSSIAEEYLSSRWFVKRYYELSGKRTNNVKSIVEEMPAEPKVQVLFSEYADNLSTFLRDFVKQEQPEVIVLGGNITKAFDLFGDKLREKLKEQNITIPIKTAQLGEEAALLGAASLWEERAKV
ncbi:ROK family protein [Pontibacter sp. KCTC 32443]|uniref:ROK family protein n=1 Tax=Pontibacter TaxID=323449 RepID=UPI00164EB770|nr:MULTISPECIES: ROK family protein [Pontibacter]MBC5773110.1 ROK family protein [Pontibacter sp. KCTC 32443]